MDIREVKEREPSLIGKLIEVWESSVRETHLFLSNDEILSIKNYVPEALRNVEHLIIAEEEEPVAFMGIGTDPWKCFSLQLQSEGKA